MVQQWFLDLDGVRSGPYQTPEVLGLIAEGEVLPHHRISSSLKDQPWITILEWRLEQARQPATPEKKSYIPEGQATGVPTPPKPYDIRWNEPAGGAPRSPAVPGNEVGAVDLNAEAGEEEIQEVIQVLRNTPPAMEPPAEPVLVPPAPPEPEPVEPHPPAAPMQIKLEPIAKPDKHEHEPPAPPPGHPHPPAESEAPPPAARAPGGKKRDPMAEMFDMLQNTRQKREAKERERSDRAHSHGSHAHPAPAHEKDARSQKPQPTGASGMKTAVIALLIITAGFMLGQLFQQHSAPPADPAASQEKNLTATGSPPAPATRTEVIDRSTDKMTIRAQVERPVEPPAKSAIAPAIPRNRPLPQAMATPAINDREMQELKDLKKELQELKALKEELKNTPAQVDDGSNIPMDEDYLSAPGFDGTGGAAYSPNDAVVDPGAGGFPTPAHDLHQPAVNY